MPVEKQAKELIEGNKDMAEETKEHWSEWFDWMNVDIYETIYDEVPCNNWDVVAIEFEHRDRSISKAYMCPYEEWTDDDYWKSYELQDEHYNYPCDTSTVVKWRFLYDWKEEAIKHCEEQANSAADVQTLGYIFQKCESIKNFLEDLKDDELRKKAYNRIKTLLPKEDA